MSKFGRILSLILVVAMLVQLLPVSVFAQESNTADPDEIDVIGLAEDYFETPEESLKNAKILFEEEELREENVKHFRLDNGSYIAVQYGNPVHYEEDGEWVDYDNTLHGVSAFNGTGVSHYTVTNGDSTRVFAADANAEVLLALQKGEYSLSLTPVDEPDAEIPVTPIPPVEMEIMGGDIGAEGDVQTDQSAVISSENIQLAQPATVLCYSGSGDVETYALPAEETSLYAQAQPEAMYSALEYVEALNGATLRYENYGNTVKESIVIDAPQEAYSYSFVLETEDLTPTVLEDGSITLTAPNGAIIYTIPAPYMIDANKEYSTNASYSLSGSDGTFILTVTADEEWINAPERVFPVLLDPTIEEVANEDSLASCFVRSGYPNSQDESDPGLYAGFYNNNNQMTRSYFHMNRLPEIPGGCEINGALLQLYYYALNPDSAAYSLDLGIYGLTEVEGLTGASDEAAWTQWINNLTWNIAESNAVVQSDVIVDKVSLKGSDIEKYQYWDITTLAYNWYNDKETNMGFVLKAINEQETNCRATFHGPGHSWNKPAVIISYKNTVGIENYYNYQTFGHGRAGMSYISDYSMQNTLVVPLIQSGSEVMPFSLELVYNSSYGGRYFTEESNDGAKMLHTKNYNDMLLGIGWKLSAQQTVVSFTEGDKDYLIYTDEDGTEHYFADDDEDGESEAEDHDGVYEDEDGLHYEITISGTDYTMTSKKDHKWYFSNGYLSWEEDPYGNRITYKYTGSKLTSITRTNKGAAEETLVTLSYDWTNKDGSVVQNKYPTAVIDQYGRKTKLQYSTPDSSIYYLRRLTFPDNQYADYIYENQTRGMMTGYRLVRVYDAESEYGMEFSYGYNGDVRNLYEYVSSSKVYGTMIHGYKRSPSQTVYRYYGKDQTDDQKKESDDNSPPDDQLMFCVLDRYGKTVGCYVTDSSERHVLGVSAAEFTENNGTDKRNNSITAAASAGLQGINLLQNSSGEAGTTGWNNATSNTDPANVYIGQKSLKFTDKTLWQEVKLEANETYTFSAYVKKEVGAQARLCIRMGGEEKATSELLNYDTSGVNNGWVRLSATYTPDQSGDYQAAVIVNGTAYADALQFEKGDAASAYNPVNDGSFEWTTQWESTGSSGIGWRKNGSTTIFTENPEDNDPEVTGYFGSDVAKLVGGGGLQRVYQIVRLNTPLDSSFLFSAWAKGAADPSSVDQKTEENDPYFGLAIRLYFSDDTSEIHYKSFDPYCHDWQYVQDIVTPDKENNEAGTITITHAAIAVAYDNNINTAYVDNVSLRLGQAQTYAYDAEGNVDTAALTGGGVEGAEYNNKGDLTKYTSPNGVVFNYTSNTKHSIIQETGAGTVTDYTYNNTGYLTSTKLSAAPPEDSSAEADPRYIKTSATSTTDKNFTSSVTDSAGNTSSYTYNAGRLEYATNPKGQTTTYTYYHQNNRSKSTYITGIAAIDYTYDNGQLSQLKRKTFPYKGAPQSEAVYQDYNFTHNAWGQQTSIAVGDQTLVINEYENINDDATTTTKGGGNHTKTTYANGDYVTYEYDRLDRLIKTTYNDTGEYIEYTYNGEGALSKLVHRRSNGTVIASYEFERDNLGRLIRSRQVDSNNATIQRTEHIYDAIGRISRQRWSIGSKNFSESYTYNDGATGNGALNTVTTSTGDKVYFTYDPLNRLETSTVKRGNTEIYTTTYEYWASDTPEGEEPDANRTSDEVKFQYTELANGTVITGNQYVYDELGNIISLYESHPVDGYQYRREVVKYTYDDQSQLTSETYYTYLHNDNGDRDSVTWNYTYDTAGNILSRSKTTKERRDGVVTTTSSTAERTYTYSTGDWKDLLTEVTAGSTTHELEYDLSGNPLTYGNGQQLYTNLTWEHGRQLTSLTTNGSVFTYDYNHEGIRTKKVVNGVTHNYITQSGRIAREVIHESGRSLVLDFIYTAAGAPFALEYYSTEGQVYATYYYITNYQGDVVALLDSDYDVVARYTYNAWGELVSVTNDQGALITDPTNIAHLNPLRYRSYYYDIETGFYYLQSRYYDPANHRFINADAAEYSAMSAYDINETNLFSYCLNNPVNRIDEAGNLSWKSVFKVVAAVAVVAVVTAACVATAGAAAVALGASTAVTSAVVSGTAIGGVVAGGMDIMAQVQENGAENIDVGSVAIETLTGSMYGASQGYLGATGSVAGRIGIVASSVVNSVLHSINDKDTPKETAKEAGKALLGSTALQAGAGTLFNSGGGYTMKKKMLTSIFTVGKRIWKTIKNML